MGCKAVAVWEVPMPRGSVGNSGVQPIGGRLPDGATSSASFRVGLGTVASRPLGASV